MNHLKIIRNAHIYAPENLGMNDILLCGNKIALIDKKIELSGIRIETFDAEGKIVTPGFIDRHVHVIGGGGQQGFASLAPEVTVSELINCGTTCVLGLLGTDGFVKDLPTLYAKVKGLSQEGLSTYMLTGYYGIPTPTLTHSVAEDLIYIDKVIGCKLAMSDDRSSFPTEEEILRLIIKYDWEDSLLEKEDFSIFIWAIFHQAFLCYWILPESIQHSSNICHLPT